MTPARDSQSATAMRDDRGEARAASVRRYELVHLPRDDREHVGRKHRLEAGEAAADVGRVRDETVERDQRRDGRKDREHGEECDAGGHDREVIATDADPDPAENLPPRARRETLRTGDVPAGRAGRAVGSGHGCAPLSTELLPASRRQQKSAPTGRGAGSAVPGGDGLQAGEAVERLEALLAAVAGVADAAERQLDAAAGAVVVEEDLPGAQPRGRGACARAPSRVQTAATRP